jgi:type VI secretion system protein ImpL
VDEHFLQLRRFVSAPEGTVTGLEQAIQKILLMYQSMSSVANASNQGQAVLNQVQGGGAGGANAAAQLQESTRNMPPAVAAIVQSVTSNANQVVNQGAGQELANAWRAQVYPLCEAAFNRYPLVANSAADVPMDDFASLLAPGGMMDQFFAKYLNPFVDRSARPWKWAAADRIPAGLSPASLAEFERAAQIRDSLFGSSKEIQVRFQLVPVTLDPQVAQITIDLAGQTLTWNHGPPEPGRFIWPGPGGKTLIRVTMTPGGGGAATIIEKDGPWSLLRILDAAKITPSGQPDKFRIAFSGGGGGATFELNASSVNNPFTMTALRSFRCPAKL